MSDLVERVAQAILTADGSPLNDRHKVSECWNCKAEARAAIAAVAEWLDPNARPEIYGHDYTASEIVAATLLKQLEQPK